MMMKTRMASFVNKRFRKEILFHSSNIMSLCKQITISPEDFYVNILTTYEFLFLNMFFVV